MAQFSMPWPDTATPGPVIGDGRAYSDSEWAQWWKMLFGEGVLRGAQNELNCTFPAPGALRVDTGAALVAGRAYWNDAPVDLPLTNAAPGTTRKDFVVLRGAWEGEGQYTVRLAIKQGTAISYPTLTQNVNQLYEVAIWQYTIDDVGECTDTKRVPNSFCRFSTEVAEGMLAFAFAHSSLAGLDADDHPQYYNAERHTKEVHNELKIDADTLDGKHASEYDAHISATSAVHGLGNGVRLVGCKQGARRIEIASGNKSFQRDKQGNYTATISVTWTNAFSSILACFTCPAPGTMYGWQSSGISSRSATGATGSFNAWYDIGSYSVYADFLAIGT